MKALCHSTREHNDFRAVFKEFLDVGNLNAGIVTSSTFAPVPFTRTTGEKFCVFVRLGLALDFQASSRNMIDLRRAVAILHCFCHSETKRSEAVTLQGTTARAAVDTEIDGWEAVIP